MPAPLEPGELGVVDAVPETRPGRTAPWRARAYYRPLDGGKLRSIEASGRTKAIAIAAVRTKHEETFAITTAGTLTRRSSVEALTGHWLDVSRAAGAWKQQTTTLYERTRRVYIVTGARQSIDGESIPLTGFPALLGSMRIDAVRPRDVAATLEWIAKHAPARMGTTRTILAQSFDRAVRDGLRDTNPARGLGKITVASKSRAKRGSRHATVDEIDAMYDTATARVARGRAAYWLPPLIALLAGSGLRIGEAIALRAMDVGFDTQTERASVEIEGTIVDRNGHPERQDAPKTETGSRSLIVSPRAGEALSGLIERDAKGKPDRLLFATEDGTPLSANNVRRAWREAVKEAELNSDDERAFTPHSIRKQVGTAMLAKHSIDDIAAYLGHTRVVSLAHYLDTGKRTSGIDPTSALMPEHRSERDADLNPALDADEIERLFEED